VWLTNGTKQDAECQVEFGVIDLVDSGSWPETLATVLSANSAHRVAHIPLPSPVSQEPGRFLPFARLSVDGQQVGTNRSFPTGFRFRDMEWPSATGHLSHSVDQVGDREFHLHVRSDIFAWAVGLDLPADVWVEDNYFDLLPGEARTIALQGWPDDVSRLRIKAANDMV
jgi:hypothetical protein